jgi:hypothetical protein
MDGATTPAPAAKAIHGRFYVTNITEIRPPDHFYLRRDHVYLRRRSDSCDPVFA